MGNGFSPEHHAQDANAKRTERSLGTYDKVFQTVRDVVYTLSPHGVITSLNPVFETLSGWTCREWIGKHFAPLIHPEDLPLAVNAFKRALEGETPPMFELRIMAKSGGFRIGEFLETPQIENGRIVGVTGIARDITQRKERDLSNLALRLETIRAEERTRISRDLHDELGQTLTAMKFEIQWIARLLSERSGEPLSSLLRPKINSILERVESTSAAVQKIAFELRPSVLDTFGLEAAIVLQVDEFATRTGIAYETHFHFDHAKITAEQSTALFRILQEALTNVERHAQATKVWVNLTEEMGRLRLEVRNNGIGIPECRVRDPQSLGLLGMRERIRPLGGEIQIVGSQGEGTRLVASLPTLDT
ncbi:MAG: hypothetical protein C4293_09445 [Nitrospiraceae bacterium]